MHSFLSKRVKLKSSALVSTVVFCLVMLIAASMLIYLLYFYRVQSSNAEIETHLKDMEYSAQIISLSYDGACGDSSKVIFNNVLTPDSTKGDSLKITLENWGLYQLCQSELSYKNKKQTSSYFRGPTQADFSDGVLYVADHGQPLSISGEASIHGKAYLPKSGIRVGYFEQKGFNGKTLVEGITDSSKAKLPEYNNDKLDYIYQLIGKINDSTLIYPLPGNKTCSFAKPVEIYRQVGPIVLDNITYHGHMVVISDSVIEITATADLVNILLVAPYIHIREGFHGSVQAVATDSIILDKSTTLTYPSALIGSVGENCLDGPSIRMNSDSKVYGSIACVQKSENTTLSPRVYVGKDAHVYGLIYNPGFTEINGAIDGSLLTGSIYMKRDNAVLDNFLMDGKLSFANWPSLGGMYGLEQSAKQNRILQWVE